MPRKTPKPTRGGALVKGLTASGISTLIIGNACAVSDTAVRKWIKGDGAPMPPARAVLSERWGVPAESWDEPPDATPEPATPPNPAPRPAEPAMVAGPGVRGIAQQIERNCRDQLARLGGSSVTELERARIMSSVTSTLRQLAKVNDEHAFWDETIAMILDALKPHPDALRAVRDALASRPVR